MLKKLTALLLALVLSFSLIACGEGPATESQSKSEQASVSESVSEPQSETKPEKKIRAFIQPEEYEIYAISDGAVAFWESDYDVAVNVAAKDYYGKDKKLDVDVPVVLNYFTDELPEDVTITSVTIGINCQEYDDSREVDVDPDAEEASASFRQLYTGATYDCWVSITFSNDKMAYGEDQFYVWPTSRILEVDGIRNVRDMGGWVVGEDGDQIIKEGLIYRGGMLTGAGNGNSQEITPAGAEVFGDVMGIKTVIDLRNDVTETGIKPEELDAYDEIVYHICTGTPLHYTIGTTTYGTIKEIFSMLADEDNYPIYYNCSWGVDRTGTLAYILGAFLGMSEDQLMRDWELSGLYVDSVNRNDSIRQGYRDFVKAFSKLSGDTYVEKAEGLLTAAGVTADEMQAIRDILLMDFEEYLG